MRTFAWSIALAAVLAAEAAFAGNVPNGTPAASTLQIVDEPEKDRALLFGPVTTSEEAPASMSCTVANLLDERPCTLESQAPKAIDPHKQADLNATRAAELGPSLCEQVSRFPSEAKSDALMLNYCVTKFASAARVCGRDGSQPLLDGESRFSAGSAECFHALRAVLRETRQVSDLYGACCKCMQAHKCGAFDQCAGELGAGKPTSSGACLRESCAADCAAAELLGEQKPTVPDRSSRRENSPRK